MLRRSVLKLSQGLSRRNFVVIEQAAERAGRIEFTGKRPIYLDFQSTTPLDPRVLDAMLPYLTEQYGNPHSRSHSYGWVSEEAVEVARKASADAKEIIFTSGATESNNLALKGVAHFNKGKKNHIVTLQTQHKCVLDSCRKLEQEGFQVTFLPIKPDGIVDLQQFQNALRPDTVAASVMMVNNEIGVIQPIKQLGAICRKHKVFLHTDAAQAVGKIPVNVNEMNIDMLSISGHKIYGPKGIGALYIRRKPRVRLVAQISGGGQERGFRSGTLPAPLVVGFGKAAQVCEQELDSDIAHVNYLSEKFLDGVRERIPRIVVNGSEVERYPGNLNISFSFVQGESLLMGVKQIAVSSGSACTSASLEPSYVLRALGVTQDLAHTSLRIGIGRFSTEEEVDAAIDLLVEKVQKLRELSPLWEMVQEGIDLKNIEWTQPH